VGGGINDGLIVLHRVGIKVINLLIRNKWFHFKFYKTFYLKMKVVSIRVHCIESAMIVDEICIWD